MAEFLLRNHLLNRYRDDNDMCILLRHHSWYASGHKERAVFGKGLEFQQIRPTERHNL